MKRKNAFSMQFYIRETNDFRFHVRIYRRRIIICDETVHALQDAQELINHHIKRSMI